MNCENKLWEKSSFEPIPLNRSEDLLQGNFDLPQTWKIQINLSTLKEIPK